MEFHEKLQQLRKQHNFTQEQLAQQLFVSRTAVSKWESGRGYPNLESLKCLSKLFSLSVDELLSNDELLELAGRKRGFLMSGGVVNTERMAKVLLDEFRGSKLGRFTLELPEESV